MVRRIISAWQYNCPRCRKDKLFEIPFDIMKPIAMPKACNNCAQLYEPEPGFYYGAMFLSYILTCGLLLPLALFMVFYIQWTVESTMGLVIFLGIIFFIRILRFSRALWIHIVVKYNPNYNK